MNLLWKIALIALGLGLLAGVAMNLFVVFTLRRFNGMPDTQDLTARVHKLANGYINKRPHGALALGVLQKDRRYVQGYGRRSSSDNVPPDGQTLFEIGSVTKVFTALAMARLVEDGSWSLEDSLGQRLALGWSEEQVAGITLRHLATHSSGLPRLPAALMDGSISLANPYLNYHPADLYQDLTRVRLDFPPGKKSTYSNYGFGLLGHLLEVEAGRPYAAIIADDICRPLGLRDTTVQLTPEQQDRLVRGHNLQGEVGNWDFDAIAGAGALRSTVQDMLLFLEANLRPDATPLAPVLERAQQVHFTGWTSHVGLGWQISETIEGPVVHWHNGGTHGYRSFIGFDRANQVAVALLSNTGDVDESLDAIGFEILKLAVKISLD
jgi:CubicO group peptidase (beta-lactamase class C family)